MPDRRRKDPRIFDGENLAILRALIEQPLSSAANLHARPDMQWASRSTIHNRLKLMAESDYVGFIERPWRQRQERRFYPHRKGLYASQDRAGVLPEWSDTEKALIRLIRQGHMLELLYDLAPRFWSSPAVHPVWREDCPLKRIRLISRGPVQAVAEYETRFPGETQKSGLLVAFAIYGLRPRTVKVQGDLRSLLNEADTEPDHTVAAPAPCGLAVLAADRMAGVRARRDLPPEVPRAIVTFKDRFGGSVIEAMRPAPERGRLAAVVRPPRHLGSPENIPDFVAGDTVQRSLSSLADYRTLVSLEEWSSGCSVDQLGKLSGHPRGAAERVERYVEAGLVERDDASLLYPTDAVQEWAVERDRLERRRTRGRPGAEISPTGTRRRHMARHEAGVNELAIAFRQAGLLASVGWKLMIHYARREIAPDLWVLVPMGGGRAIWHAVEYERSAPFEKKARSYDHAHELGEAVPLLMVCETARAAARFAKLRGDLPMLVATHREVARGFRADKPVWRWDDQRTHIAHLTTMRLWPEAAGERRRYVLMERTR